ncbi:MAG: GNAT family N-acetyltransferase [Roseburia sp.]
MKMCLLTVIENLKEEDRRKLEKQLREPCYDWDFQKRQQRKICFSPIFLQGEKELDAYLQAAKNEREELNKKYKMNSIVVLSDDSQCLIKTKKSGIARIGYQEAGKQEFLDGTDLIVENLEDIEPEMLYQQIQREAGIPWTILETERLVVREFQMSDLDELFHLYEGKGMTDYMEPLYSYEKEKEYQQAYITYMYRYYGYGMWLVFEKESGKLIGRAGIEHREEFKGELELGYAIGTSYQRKGYATEVCLAIMEYCKEYLGVQQLFCMIEVENKASIALAEKIGFVLEKECMNEGKRMCIMRCIL